MKQSKGRALLLALVMVFSINTTCFAESEKDVEASSNVDNSFIATPDNVEHMISEIDVQQIGNPDENVKQKIDNAQKAFDSLTEQQQASVDNYNKLQDDYQIWLEEMGKGIFGSFAEILQSDFNPSWDMTKEQFEQKYNLKAISEGNYCTEIWMLDQEFLCLITFDNAGKIGYCSIGAKKESDSMTDLYNYISNKTNNVFVDVKPIVNPYVNQSEIGIAYYTEGGSTIITVKDPNNQIIPHLLLASYEINTEHPELSYFLLVNGHKFVELREMFK